MIAVSIGHGGYDPVIATTLQAKKQIRNPSHHFTNAESELALAVTAYSAATLAAFFIALGLLPQLGY